jgi:hypothetical protein
MDFAPRWACTTTAVRERHAGKADAEIDAPDRNAGRYELQR